MKPKGQLSDMDLKLLRVYVAVVKAGGLSAAEISLNMSVSNISARLSDLEQRLGMRLCERGRHGFSLTEQGQQVYGATQELIQSIEHFTGQVQATQGHITGELRLILTDNTLSDPNFLIVPIIQRFQSQASQVHIRLDVGSRSEVERAVVNGEVQLGITSLTQPLENLVCHYLYPEEYFLYCGRSHPLFDQGVETVTQADIDNCCFIDHAPGSHGSDPITGAKQTATAAALEARATLILAGNHVGFLPSHYSQRWTRAGQMRALLPEAMCYKKDMYALTKKGRASNAALNLFIETLLQAYSPAVGEG
ncbi:LysR family transcriptional regulator [Pseudomonas sp. MPC6]|uniref:LysR family transcriptional regulator n=1 Tax=unclassified Pseudomonas TaxID=196821 RepID=UPI0011107E72|nr:LysR family transcriptional regulator [Pseudomonas sp. MPC6]QCY09455.1 LysR family transcriptional regulator [Pseudomonas sp. MPC6]